MGSHHNQGIKRSVEEREFAKPFKLKKYKNMVEWNEDYIKLRMEQAGKILELSKYAYDLMIIQLDGIQQIMGMPNCPPALYVKCVQSLTRVSSQLNNDVDGMYRIGKMTGAKPEVEPLKAAPPDFADNGG